MEELVHRNSEDLCSSVRRRKEIVNWELLELYDTGCSSEKSANCYNYLKLLVYYHHKSLNIFLM